MKRIMQIFLLFMLLGSLSAIVYADMVTDIDASNSSSGIVKVLYNTGKDIKVKVIITKGEDKVIYSVKNNANYVSFPLQYGNGTYTVGIYENTTDTKYRKVASSSFDVTLKDENIVFLQSIQNINFTVQNEAIKLATDLSKSKLTDEDKIQTIYDFIAKNIEYEWAKVDNLPSDYVPEIDTTLKTKLGICYDYSSLYASMLRSQGIPSKLIKGYCVNTPVYHAWNEVFLPKEKRWVVVDLTFDAYLNNFGTKEVFEKKAADYQKLYQY